jgi:D-alanyl-D-alanine carboxypeptidase
LVFDFENHQILSEKKADRILYPASLTKVMTLYLTFEALQKGKLNLDQKLKFSAYAEEVSNINKYNTLHAKEGEVISLRQAIQSVIIKSYNEAAIVLAEAVAGDEWKFVRLMNKKARELGMINTSFRNASGLHEDGQYTTAYDLARLTIAIKKKFPAYYHFFAEKKFKYRGEEYETHNKIILEYQGAEGLKTGFTNASGYNLISVAKRKGRRIASILLRCSNLEKRGLLTVELLDKGFKAEGGHGFYRNKIIDAFDYSSPQLSSFGLR